MFVDPLAAQQVGELTFDEAAWMLVVNVFRVSLQLKLRRFE
jgi:hypothetical protein